MGPRQTLSRMSSTIAHRAKPIVHPANGVRRAAIALSYAAELYMTEVQTPSESESNPGPSGLSRSMKIRLGALLLIGVVFFAIAYQSGLLDDKRATMERIRTLVLSAGPYGFGVFMLIYLFGELFHVPGILFFATGIYVWGSVWGGLAGYCGSIFSCTAIFFIVRKVGGQPLAQLRYPWVRKILDRLELHPIRIMVVLRTVMWNAPQLNYAFALSRIRFRDYFVGSLLGLIIPVVVQSLFLEKLLHWMMGA